MTYFNQKQINYEGPYSNNPLSFKYFNPQEVIGGKTMAEHMKFSVAYWHTFTETCLTRSAAVQLNVTGITLKEWTKLKQELKRCSNCLKSLTLIISVSTMQILHRKVKT